MNEEIRRPKTSCVLSEGRIISCDDYVKADGKIDYSCCAKCGWNPDVAQKRATITRERLLEESLAKNASNEVLENRIRRLLASYKALDDQFKAYKLRVEKAGIRA